METLWKISIIAWDQRRLWRRKIGPTLIIPTNNLRYHWDWELYLPRQGKNYSEERGTIPRFTGTASPPMTSFMEKFHSPHIFLNQYCERCRAARGNFSICQPTSHLGAPNDPCLHRNVSLRLHYFWRFESRWPDSSSHFTVLITPNLV